MAGDQPEEALIQVRSDVQAFGYLGRRRHLSRRPVNAQLATMNIDRRRLDGLQTGGPPRLRCVAVPLRRFRGETARHVIDAVDLAGWLRELLR